MTAKKGSKQYKLVLVKGLRGVQKKHRLSVRGLGLRKTNSQAIVSDHPAVMGMVNQVRYLLKVEEV